MFVAPFSMQSGGAGLVAPVLSNLTPLIGTEGATWGLGVPQVFPYTSTSGNVAFMAGTRGQLATTRDMVETWNADAMTEIATAAVNGSGHSRCEAAIKGAGSTGLHNLSVEALISAGAFRFLIGWAFDLDQIDGGIGGKNAVAINVSQAFVEATIVVQQAGSLLVAAGWSQNYLCEPYTFTAGWTKLDEKHSSTNPNRPSGAIAFMTATAAGSQTVRMSSALANTDWAMVVAEFLPG